MADLLSATGLDPLTPSPPSSVPPYRTVLLRITCTHHYHNRGGQSLHDLAHLMRNVFPGENEVPTNHALQDAPRGFRTHVNRSSRPASPVRPVLFPPFRLLRSSTIVAAFAVMISFASLAGAQTPEAVPIAVLDRVGPASFFSGPLGVAVDTTGGLIVIADTGNHRIRIFDLDGYPISSFTHWVDGPRGKQRGEPKALAVDRHGFLYVLDTMATYVDVMDLLGNPVRRIDPASFSPGGIDSTATIGPEKVGADMIPVALALDPEDLPVLAVGGQRSRIVGLDEHNRVRWTLDGSEGGGEPFGSITSLFVDGEGRIFVADGTGVPTIRGFSSDGRGFLGFGAHETGNENFSFPSSVATTADGRIWVLDTLRQVVQVYSRSGAFLGKVGGMGQEAGSFFFPSALATNGKTRLYVVDRVGARLTTFRITEQLVQANP